MRISQSLRLPLLLVTLLAQTAPTLAVPRRTVPRPPNVPVDFVATPNGFFHPSCVITLGADEVMGHDLVVRGLDGRRRRNVDACAWPRYSVAGRMILPGPSETDPTSSFYDGWVTAYWYTGSLPSGTSVSAKWVVPPTPANDPVSGSNAVVIFYFNDVEMQEGNDVEILQPVLGYDQSDDAEWTIQGWNCCDSGLEKTSTAVKVNPGDVIEGVTAGASCDSAGVCQTWTVTTTDLTTGQSTVLNTTEPNAPNIVNPAVLEAYGVTACNMFPPGGEETFFDHTVTSGTGSVLSLAYDVQDGAASGAPSCGYGGKASGNNYTLIYSSAPTLITTTTTVTTPSPALHVGMALPLTATVTTGVTSPAFAGSVTFYDGATVLGSADVVSGKDSSGHEEGTATLTLSAPAGGTHQITATFGGDDGYQPSTSAALAVEVSKWPTTTTLTAAPTTLKEGATAVLTATVATGASGSVTVATGNVLFSAGSTGLGGVLLSSGSAVFDASALPVGASAITASYQGDSNYAPSMSASVSVTVLSTLAIAPQIDHVPPRGTVSFSATSGVPPIRWTLKTNASGGSIAASTGAYTAGAKPGAVDEVLATDKDGATANATVEIGAGVSIAPTNASTTSGGTIAFSASGGSGSGFQWSLGPGGSGGSINAATGAYRAGETGGTTDIVTVTDSLGNMSSVHVTVSQSTPSGSSGPSGAASPTGQTGPTTGGGGCSCGAAGAPGGLLETAALALLWMMALARRRHARR